MRRMHLVTNDRAAAVHRSVPAKRRGHHQVGRVALWLLALGGPAAAGLLAGLRLTDPSASLVVELVAFTPLGLPLAGLGAVSAALLSLWAGRRTVPLLLVSLTLTALHTFWLVPLYAGEVPEAAAGPRLVVLTQNFEYGDPQSLVHLVSEFDADVMVVTDAASARIDALLDAGIGTLLPHASDHARGGSVVFSRFPVIAEHRISEGGDSRLVTLDVPGLGALDVLALHPTPPYQRGQWSSDWEAILTFVRDTYSESAAGQVVVAGDLNATNDHAPFRELTALGFSDAVEQTNAGWLPTWPADRRHRLGLPIPALLPIDHVMAGPGLVAVRVIGRHLSESDHRAVVATLAPRL